MQFNKHHENKEEKIDPEYKYDRYVSPEKAQNLGVGIQNDIWLMGCIIVEIFSKNEIWSPLSKDDMMRDLKRSFVPKIHPDVPKHMWGMVCECLNPFPETRIDAKELLERYTKLMHKLKIPELAKHLGIYIINNRKKIYFLFNKFYLFYNKNYYYNFLELYYFNF